jgi:HlyD family secretion protein
MRRRSFLVFLPFAMLLAACNGVASTATPTAIPAVKADTRIIADGHVVPIRSADLSFGVSGTVDEVLISEGDAVTMDQPLIRLSNARQRAAVAQSEADLQRAQAQLNQTRAGSRSQEIDGARAAVDAAQAHVDSLKAGASDAEIAAAKADVAQAQAILQKAQTPVNASDIAAAKADMDNAAAKLRVAQSQYDQVGELPGVGGSPQSLQLEQATNEYNAAKARYDSANSGPNAADIANAKAQLDKAKAQLQAKQAPPRPADLAAAQADVRQAQAKLDLLLAGPEAEELLVAEANVASAQAALEQAQASLAETELRSPFAGTIAAVDVVVGQQVGPGVTAVQLGDFSSWLVETRDLTELRVVGVRPGDKATLTFDAIPGLELPGQVARIRSIGQNTQGDITYTVSVAPDHGDDRLLWNMTAKVQIEPGSGPGALSGPAATAIAQRPPTRTPTPTHEPTETPEPAPTLAPTATITPTVAPTATAPKATSGGAPGARATQPPAATPVPAVPPVLVSPKDGESVRGAVIFTWQPGGPLPAGALYEVVWWGLNEGPSAARGLAPATTKTQAKVNVDLMVSSGELKDNRFYWTVIIVRQNPYTRLTQPTQEGARLLVWSGPLPTPPPRPKG